MLSLGFWEPILITAGLNAIVALGVYITLKSGQLSVGHAAFMAMGAYTAAVLTTNFGVAFPFAVLGGMLVGLLVGGLLSLVTMKMNELVMGLTTLGFGETMVVIAFNTEYIGGANSFSGIRLMTDLRLVSIVLAAVIYLAWRLDCSRLGLAARAVRDSPVTAAAMGINVPWVRVLTFGLGASIAGLGGALSAHYTLVVNPDDMTFFRSLGFVIFVVFGGSYAIWGPVAGALVLTILPEVLRVVLSLSEALSLSLRFIAYGLILVLVVLLRPEGVITRVPTGGRPWFLRPRRAPPSPEPAASAQQAATARSNPARSPESPADDSVPPAS